MNSDAETYVCSACKGVFVKARTDSEAMEESNQDFGPFNQEECELVCDDCYHKFMAWFAQTQRQN